MSNSRDREIQSIMDKVQHREARALWEENKEYYESLGYDRKLAIAYILNVKNGKIVRSEESIKEYLVVKTEEREARASWEENEDYYEELGYSRKEAIKYILSIRRGEVGLDRENAVEIWKRNKSYYENLGKNDMESAIQYILNRRSEKIESDKKRKIKETISIIPGVLVILVIALLFFGGIYSWYDILSTPKKSDREILNETLQKSIQGKPLRKSEQMHLDGLYKQMNK